MFGGSASQHGYTSTWHALKSIYTKEGFKGLYRGSGLSVMRSMVGSGANLSSYSLLKEHLLNKEWKDNVWTDMVCGLSSGVVSW